MPEETQEYIYYVLFVDDIDKCTQCDHPESRHRVVLDGVEELVICDCRTGSKAEPMMRDIPCYNDELKQVYINEVNAPETGEF